MAKSSKQSRKRRVLDIAAEPQPDRRVRKKSAQIKADEAWQRSQAAPLVCLTAAQERYLATIRQNIVTFGVGPAGTGKSHIALKYACQEIDAGRYQGIVILRPLVEMGDRLGALPGELKDKMAPWSTAFMKILYGHYGRAVTEAKLNGAHPSIEFQAIQHIRGDTFADRIVIVDEAQNTTPEQMKTILTRIGEDSKLILNGDLEQSDIRGKSGLAVAMEIISHVANVGVARFVEEDIVRSGICKDILIAYRDYARAKQK